MILKVIEKEEIAVQGWEKEVEVDCQRLHRVRLQLKLWFYMKISCLYTSQLTSCGNLKNT